MTGPELGGEPVCTEGRCHCAHPPVAPIPHAAQGLFAMLIISAGGRIDVPEELLYTLATEKCAITINRHPETGGVSYQAAVMERLTDADIERLLTQEPPTGGEPS